MIYKLYSEQHFAVGVDVHNHAYIASLGSLNHPKVGAAFDCIKLKERAEVTSEVKPTDGWTKAVWSNDL
jgi:hypothetical protein